MATNPIQHSPQRPPGLPAVGHSLRGTSMARLGRMLGVDGGGAMRVRMGATAMLVLCVLTGCSGSNTDNHSPGSGATQATTEPVGAEARAGTPGVAVPDPCVLITREDAAKVIGEADSSALAPGGQPGQRSCGYASSGSGKLVAVAVWPSDQAAFDKLKASAGTVTAVTGVGESAFSSSNAIYARKGQFAVSVFVVGITPESAVPTTLSGLVGTALSRM